MKKLVLFGLICVIGSLPMCLNAQINLKGKLKDATNNRANSRVDQGIDKSMDAVENGVKNLFKKKKKADDGGQAEENAQEEQKPAANPNPSLQLYSKFDFIPGEKVIFFEDFSQDAVGDFPVLWNTNGSGEIKSTNLFPGKWLAIKAASTCSPNAKISLSGNYTIEFDLILATDPENTMNESVQLSILNNAGWKLGDNIRNGFTLNFKSTDMNCTSWKSDEIFLDAAAQSQTILSRQGDCSKPVKVSIWVQKQRMRCYLNNVKVYDLPQMLPPNATYNALQIYNYFDGNTGSPLISNLRIAQGLPDTRNKLLTEGKLVTYGIYFDVNKDVVKPESYGTLKEIAGILNEVPDVKVKIVGHTDSDGEDAKNMDLSKRRAASVKAELAKTFGVNADRLVTDGMGETQPVAPNDTPANKALNRRVEFIKL
jgi:outer membrane protein OmpA-like peptidoglycan-associated protein